MAEFIKPPKFDAPTAEGKIKQIETYLFQLHMQLNYMHSLIEKKGENE